jgi:hypothetical protein
MGLSKRRTLLVLVGGAAVLATSLGTTGASAATYDEIYRCTRDARSTGDTDIGKCTGTWWNINSRVRTLEINFYNVTHYEKTGYNNTPIYEVKKTDDFPVRVYFYCRNEKYSINSYIGYQDIGGPNHPKSVTWSNGWNPCTGNWTGMRIKVKGTFKGHTMCTDVDTNTWYYIFAQRGYEKTSPSSGGC